MWNANLMQQGNFIDIFLAQHVSGTYVHVPYTRPTQQLATPPPVQKFGAQNHMLQLNM